MRSTPRVSVVIPTRDRLPLLAQTLHTVLAQDLGAIEVVVVDDASSDATSTWLAGLGDDRVRTLRHATSVGVSGARNAGVAVARAPWVAFVDDDDLWAPDKLSAQLAAAEAEGASWAFTGAMTVMSGPRLLARAPGDAEAVRWLPWHNTVPGGGSSVLVRREALAAVGGFDPSASIVADWDMWIRLRAVGPPAVVVEPLVAYRLHATNMSADLPRMLAGIQAIEARYRHLRDGEPLDWPRLYRWLGANALLAGEHLEAYRLARRAARAGHPGARWRALRSLVPLRPRLPVGDVSEATDWRSRVRGPLVVPWPDGARAWVSEAMQVVVTRPTDQATASTPRSRRQRWGWTP